MQAARGEALEALLPLIRSRGGATEASRQPDQDVVRALGEAGLMRMVVPVAHGGHGIDLVEFIRFGAAVSRAHGSTGWVATTCNEEAGIASAHLPASTMQQLYRENPAAVVAGSGVPRGRATKVDDGWNITGRWTFVSGCTRADHIVLASLVKGSNRDGPLQLCYVLVERAACEIEDTWDTVGLRGTGSHDVVLTDHFVPTEWSGVRPAASSDAPQTPFYQLPPGLRFPWPKVGVASGLARAAIDAFTELAGAKQPLNLKGQLRDRPIAQNAVARAEALVSSGFSWAIELADELWSRIDEGRPVDEVLHARCRLACSTSVQNSIQAVELVASAAGSSANFNSSPFGTLLADARAVAGHFMVAPYQVDTAGRVLLGLEAGDISF
ncbi:MAG: acyl-CoA dehydrogenase family protein [Acidimicrobiales bacterium]|jgi:alkylation response protein AidB-like acyl-CoA dehydrogenase